VSKIPLNQLAKMSGTASTTTATATAMLYAGGPAATSSVSEVQPLTDIFVPLETIQPGDTLIS